MKNLAQKILALFPESRPGIDWIVESVGGVQRIVRWNLAAPQPTGEQLAAAGRPPPRLAERTKLQVRRWMRARGKEAQYDALLGQLAGTDKADQQDAGAYAWNDPAVAGLRANAVQALGMTEVELRACFEEG